MWLEARLKWAEEYMRDEKVKTAHASSFLEKFSGEG